MLTPLSAALVTTTMMMAAAPAPPEGRRIDLPDDARLFVPAGYRPEDHGGRFDVLLHLHGAPEVVEAALVEIGAPAVLVEFNRKGLSSVYARPFGDDPGLFPRLLENTRAALKTAGLADDPALGRVVVSSFSAGFGGVREMLKVPEHFDRIDGLVMADSIYAGYTGDPAASRVDPKLMEGFARFARGAAEGNKTFVLSHSAQVPGGYASTTETADFLLAAVGGAATPDDTDRGDGWRQTRRFQRGGFLVLGFAGAEGADHMRHLRRIDQLWAEFYRLAPRRP